MIVLYCVCTWINAHKMHRLGTAAQHTITYLLHTIWWFNKMRDWKTIKPHFNKMLIILWLYFISAFHDASPALIYHQTITPQLKGNDLQSATIIFNTTADIIFDSNERIASLYKVKLDNLRSAPFEVGYLVYTIQEKYRKMVDKYNTSHFMNTKLYVMELVMYLEEIEHHFWEIEHLNNMAHEIERKYKILTSIDEDYRLEKDKLAGDSKIMMTTPFNPYSVTITKRKKFKWSEYMKNYHMSTTKKRGRGRFPFDYGWDVPGASATPLELDELMKELSWNLRLKLLNEMKVSTPTTKHEIQTVTVEIEERRNNNQKRVVPTRRVGVEALVTYEDEENTPKRRQNEVLVGPPATEVISADENNMRLKLFRLMYETVRDSDLKVKRAELIQEHYTNTTRFQIGYLMGDVTDKFTVMTDIASTLARFYGEWKPIEHINAYEQIANQAIEISHLIDLVRLASKRDAMPADHRRV